jgi:hypothetical protein
MTSSQLKIFQALSETWRHDIDFNALCFRVVAKLTNVIFEYKPL